ncbi:hypothetical protein SCATT_00070 [Streptantibioticus cattleyicolor NRRL 8057 = DSM 46488]|uniref:Integral membrane protein n=1 Tax=Streptantibioticus cattleyicolor (strain ATCC 35852 / DSM 46488 / JCM 4925 / NBRC 14057 / NRRL 8057) TaxID=1003195 RepID=G8WVT3_STREN|nr:hypothetical protein SCATT_00070 [Streptantibioticus cattleyicolor NRRL 8057 = DSM 46488]
MLAATAIHAYEATDADVPFLLVGFIASAVGTGTAALLLVARAPRLGWALGGLTALLTFVGYVVTRATPIPTDEDDYGNWLELLGVVSLVVEAIIVVMAVWALAGATPGRLRRSDRAG